jgi:hypothetical protein
MKYDFVRNQENDRKNEQSIFQRRYVMDIVYVGIVIALFVLSLLFVKLVEKA